MKIIYKVGDLLNADERFICHGCNAQGKMGSGVAKLIRAKYPHAYEVYMNVYARSGLQLGTTSWAKGEPHTVINAITQDRYGNDGKRYADYDAIRKAMAQINATARMTQTVDGAGQSMGRVIAVAMPLIGAGLAGGDWSIISEIIEQESTHFQPVVYTLDGVVPGKRD